MIEDDNLAGAVSELQADLDRKVKDRFAEGTVIRWISAGKYRYAVIKAAGKWYVTGAGRWYGESVFSYDELIDQVLGQPEVSDVEVASSWEAIA